MDERSPSQKAANFLKIFEEGKKFTEDLLKENERLRRLIEKERLEKQDLQTQSFTRDAERYLEKIRSLESETGRLGEDNKKLRERFSTIEIENREFADRYVQVERQNSNLVNMYVASYRLHATLIYEEVLQTIKEIVINMVGSETFGIYILDKGANELHLIDSEGLTGEDWKRLPVENEFVGKAIKEGKIVFDKSGFAQPRVPGKKVAIKDKPLAVIPLKVDADLLGVIVVFGLLVQKNGFQPLDEELFELLGGQAATAIYASKLFSTSERKRRTLESFLDLLKK